MHVTRTAVEPCELELDSSELNDIKADLVDKSFGWKGNHFTIRSFARGAGHNELGLQAVQLVGDADGDCDRVANELILGDMTAPTVYMAALQRPVSQIEPAAGQPNNEISSAEGQVHLKGELASEEEEIATAHCFSGFRRCGVGPGLADPYDSLQLSASMFLTRSLAGVGLTGSQLHDVRATQLCEVIVRHGGDVAQSASQFKRLSAHAQLVACIENLLIYLTEEGHDEAPRLPVRDIDRLSFWGP